MVGGKRRRRKEGTPQAQDGPVSLQLIASKLDRLVWRKRFWGVDEQQAWHVIQRLDEMYRQLYREQQLRYEVLLSEARAQGASEQSQPTAKIQGQPASQPQPATQTAQPPARPLSQLPQMPSLHTATGERPAGTRFKTR